MRQICYASTSTSDHVQLLQDVRDILSEARDFNALHNISGVLYYADQHYFQCLEGKRPLNPIPILIRFRFPAVRQQFFNLGHFMCR